MLSFRPDQGTLYRHFCLTKSLRIRRAQSSVCRQNCDSNLVYSPTRIPLAGTKRKRCVRLAADIVLAQVAVNIFCQFSLENLCGWESLRSSRKNVSSEEQIMPEHIFTPNGGFCVYYLSIFFATRAISSKNYEYLSDIPQF